MTTENLHQLYDETALKFDEYNTIKASLEAESVIIEGMEADLDEAKERFDITEMKNLTSKLEQSKLVYNDMTKNLDKLDKSINIKTNENIKRG